MQKIPKTFCPAKWNEINLNLNYNYVYACCKATPIQFVDSISDVLSSQKDNLLNGIQDSSCDFCWENENNNLPSARLLHLENFNTNTYPSYVNNTVLPKSIEVNLGNECNFQCTYCNPKFSSTWETDIRKKPYTLTTDIENYELIQKQPDNIANTIKWLNTQSEVESLILIGGEPMTNKNLFKILDATKFENIGVVTNLSCNTAVLDKIFQRAKNYTGFYINISLDSTGTNAEFSRYGMDYNVMLRNIQYIQNNAPPNVHMKFLSLMTSITIRDIDNIALLIDKLHTVDNTIRWELHACQFPQIQALTTLPDEFKPAILKTLANLKNNSYIQGVELIESIVSTIKFNESLYHELQEFLQEFSTRKKIDITTILTEQYGKAT
jgi:MoaA/NifB/PqqE/SkfB family radical SAM enzyme